MNTYKSQSIASKIWTNNLLFTDTWFTPASHTMNTASTALFFGYLSLRFPGCAFTWWTTWGRFDSKRHWQNKLLELYPIYIPRYKGQKQFLADFPLAVSRIELFCFHPILTKETRVVQYYLYIWTWFCWINRNWKIYTNRHFLQPKSKSMRWAQQHKNRLWLKSPPVRCDAGT